MLPIYRHVHLFLAILPWAIAYPAQEFRQGGILDKVNDNRLEGVRQTFYKLGKDGSLVTPISQSETQGGLMPLSKFVDQGRSSSQAPAGMADVINDPHQVLTSSKSPLADNRDDGDVINVPAQAQTSSKSPEILENQMNHPFEGNQAHHVLIGDEVFAPNQQDGLNPQLVEDPPFEQFYDHRPAENGHDFAGPGDNRNYRDTQGDMQVYGAQPVQPVMDEKASYQGESDTFMEPYQQSRRRLLGLQPSKKSDSDGILMIEKGNILYRLKRDIEYGDYNSNEAENEVKGDQDSEGENEVDSEEDFDKENEVGGAQDSEEENEVDSEEDFDKENKVKGDQDSEEENEVDGEEDSDKENKVKGDQDSEEENEVDSAEDSDKENEVEGDQDSEGENEFDSEEDLDNLIETFLEDIGETNKSGLVEPEGSEADGYFGSDEDAIGDLDESGSAQMNETDAGSAEEEAGIPGDTPLVDMIFSATENKTLKDEPGLIESSSGDGEQTLESEVEDFLGEDTSTGEEYSGDEALLSDEGENDTPLLISVDSSFEASGDEEGEEGNEGLMLNTGDGSDGNSETQIPRDTEEMSELIEDNESEKKDGGNSGSDEDKDGKRIPICQNLPPGTTCLQQIIKKIGMLAHRNRYRK